MSNEARGFLSARFAYWERHPVALRPDQLPRLAQADFVIARVVVDSRDNAGDDVADVVIATRGAIAEDGDWFTLADQLCEFVDREIGMLSWPIDGEKPQADTAQPVQMRIRMTKKLAGAFGCSVRRDWLADRIVFAE